MLKIVVVEKQEARRAELVDAICEMPGVLASSAGGFKEAIRILSNEPADAVILGALPEVERRQLTLVARNVVRCDVIDVEDATELVGTVETLLARARRNVSAPRTARTEVLALGRASGLALAQRLRAAQKERVPRGMQTLVLKEWLPAVCASFTPMMPAYVELVPIVSGDAPAVRCVPEILEREIFDMVLDAAAKLPWGGTIWLTAELVDDDTVRIDVLENGHGTGDDVRLCAAAPVAS